MKTDGELCRAVDDLMYELKELNTPLSLDLRRVLNDYISRNGIMAADGHDFVTRVIELAEKKHSL